MTKEVTSRKPQTRYGLHGLLLLVLITFTIVYGYTQYLNKSLISAVLQYKIDLRNPPDQIFAITTFDQRLPSGKSILKGTQFVGKLASDNQKLVIYFDVIKDATGKGEQFTGKSNLNLNEELKSDGVSAKIGKTLYQQTKTNVLGAIFYTGNVSQQILPQGFKLKIETD